MTGVRRAVALPDSGGNRRRSTGAGRDASPLSAPGKRVWPIERPLAAWSGAGILLALSVVEALLLCRWLALSLSPARVALGLAMVVLGLGALAMATRLVTSLTLYYAVDADSLTIVRGMTRWVIPLLAIETVYEGEPRAVLMDGEVLPGFALGRGYVKDGGKAMFFTTRSAGSSVAVRTADATYLLSPAGRGFVDLLEARRGQAGPALAAAPGAGPFVMLRRPLAVTLAAAAAFGNAALYAYIVWWYPVLPELPVHFSADGLPDRWGPPSSVFWLPQIGTIIFLANVLLALLPPLRRSMTTYVPLAAALLVQVLLGVAFQLLLP